MTRARSPVIPKMTRTSAEAGADVELLAFARALVFTVLMSRDDRPDATARHQPIRANRTPAATRTAMHEPTWGFTRFAVAKPDQCYAPSSGRDATISSAGASSHMWGYRLLA